MPRAENIFRFACCLSGATLLILFHHSFGFTIRCFLLQRFAFIVQVSTFAETDFHLYAPMFEVYAQGNQGQSFSCQFGVELDDLLFVQEQAFGATRIVVVNVAILIRQYVEIVQEHLPVFDAPVTLFDAEFAGAYRLHFRSLQG